MAEHDGIGWKGCKNVFVELFHVNENGSVDCRSEENGCPEGGHKLFLGEHRSEIVGVDPSVIPIPLFWVDIPLLGEGIRLFPKVPRAETNGKVKLGEELQPVGLMTSQDLGCGKVGQVLVVGDHIDQGGGALQIMLPMFEGFKDGQQLLVMGIVVQLWGGHSL